MTLAARFDARCNSLNALRLALAVAVIVSHSWAIGGYGAEPELGGAHLGTWAVLGFFSLSGFLITRSRLRVSPAAYYRARALRVVPGLVVCLAVTAMIFAPLSTVVAGSWDSVSALTYLLRNVGLYPPSVAQDDILTTLQTVPYQGVWNGSLWTLFWEGFCYLVIGLLASVVPRGRVRPAVATSFVLCSALSLATALEWLSLPGIGDRALPLLVAFLAGALVFLCSASIQLTEITALLTALCLAVVTTLELVTSLGALPLALLLLWVGSLPHLAPIGRKYDASYGVYIYAWPVQQLIALFAGHRLDVSAFVALSILSTLPFAYVSCIQVEMPCSRQFNRPVFARAA